MVGPQRRLSAILSADVVGYGKLVRDDETGTIEAVKRLLSVVIAPKLEEHAGRIVKLMGDGVLAEFPSVVGRGPGRIGGGRPGHSIPHGRQSW